MREKWARRVVFLTGLLVLLLAIVFANMQNPVGSPGITASGELALSAKRRESPVLEPERIEAGRQVYQQQNCARCHSVAGTGNPRVPLDAVGAKRTAEELRDWIIAADALQEELPEHAFKLKQAYGELASDDLDALVIYMQSLHPEN
jgi:mono/diheme cytochrome c family protein